MQFFELHFNPQKKEGLIFDSFCFEPGSIYEKRLGSFFVVGELKNVLPQNLKFLDNFATFLKKQYYSAPIKSSPEASLKEALKKTNEFLEQIAKSGNVSWLGNFNLAILSLVTQSKKYWELNFTKTGEIEILLLRKGQIIDIGKNLELSEIEPYPLKIFSNIVSGKLIENDIILVLTKEVFSGFGNLLEKIVPFEEKKFKEILKEKEKEFLKISGACLLCHLKEIPSGEQKIIPPMIFRPKMEKFSIPQIFSPILKLIRLPLSSKILLGKIGAWKSKLSFPKFKLKFSLPSKILLKKIWEGKILILVLISFLIIGFFLFRGEKIKELQLSQEVLREAESKKLKAEGFLILKDEKQASFLFQEAWEKTLPQTKTGAPLRKEALLLKEKIEEQLFLLNKLEKIKEPDLFFEFKQREILIPHEILTSKQKLYFSNPFSSKIYKLNLIDKSGNFLDAKRNVKLGAVFDDSILFSSKPNILLSLKNDEFKEKIIQPPLPEFNFDKFFSFRSNIYFLDTKLGEIVKYPPPNFEKDTPLIGRPWLNPATKKPIMSKSMAIDGSIWILTENNEIDRYLRGLYRETLKFNLFPELKNPTKIWTSEKSPEIYLLEPKQKRIIILSKKGEIIKQYQSEKFGNLLDFAVCEKEKTIYLLNGLNIYQILL